VKLPVQRSLSRKGGSQSASRGCDCQHQRGRAPGSGGWVNPGEAVLNVVTNNKPKMLSGLDQNGAWSGPGVATSPGADAVPPAESCDPATWFHRRNVVSPSPSREGKLPVRAATGRRVEEEGASEGRPVTGRIGVATSPHAKAGRLPSGVGGCERSANRRSRQCRCRWGRNGLAGAACATEVLSVAGTGQVMPRLPRGQPRAVRGVVGRRSRAGSYLAGTLPDA
jgi:hypothetical protein